MKNIFPPTSNSAVAFRNAGLYLLAALMVVSAVPARLVLAEPAPLPSPEEAGISKEEFYRESNINFFGEDIGGACGAGNAASGDITNLIGSDNVEMAWGFFIQKGLTPEQAAGVMGNLMVESGLQPDNQQNGRTFPGGGWGIAQWTNPGRRDAIAAAVQAAGLPYTDEQTPPGQIVKLLTFELNYLYKESVSRQSVTDDNAANEWEGLRNITGTGKEVVKTAMIYWEENYERAGVPALGARLEAAHAIYDEYKSRSVPNALAGGGSGSTGCGTASGGIVGGSVAQTAVGLAWPQPFKERTPDQTSRTSALTPSPAYAAALQQFNPDQRSDGADCGVFVSTVLRASGVDPDFPGISTGAQFDYMKSNPDKYLDLGTTTSTAKLQPGDILNIPNHSSPTGVGHTFIYVGPQPGGYTTASASLDGRSGNLTNDDIVDRRGMYTIFRPNTSATGVIIP